MQIEIDARHLGDVVVVVPGVFEDSRGLFSETLSCRPVQIPRFTHRFCSGQPFAVCERVLCAGFTFSGSPLWGN